ncbi:melanoregulin [Oxyura jamaicensis]|uniref:melanoregulin n=1 Tax=Oxyura jamaicensis TaxID=8884 RepID=UPI0015A59FE3|nr:melanoregulin [Oxyura jamaicensis]
MIVDRRSPGMKRESKRSAHHLHFAFLPAFGPRQAPVDERDGSQRLRPWESCGRSGSKAEEGLGEAPRAGRARASRAQRGSLEEPMGLRAWLRSLGGCCGCCGGEAAAPEKEPLLSNNNPYASFGATLARDEEQNLWSTPHDVTHTEADDDRVLYNMIVGRSQLDKDSEEWQKLNYDIYTLRQTRKEVRSRWKHILEDLGFQKEADSLLSVTKLSIISDSQNMGKARDILLKLSEETNIFPTSWQLSERYLFVVDRLIALDAADEFFKMASVVYPKRAGVERADEKQVSAGIPSPGIRFPC